MRINRTKKKCERISVHVSHRPDGELYQMFRNQFLSYSMYISKISLKILVTLLCNNDLCIVLYNIVLFPIQILFSFSSTTTRVAAYTDLELLEKDITWTLQLVGSFPVCFSLLHMYPYCRCIHWHMFWHVLYDQRGFSLGCGEVWLFSCRSFSWAMWVLYCVC